MRLWEAEDQSPPLFPSQMLSDSDSHVTLDGLPQNMEVEFLSSSTGWGVRIDVSSERGMDYQFYFADRVCEA